MTGDAIMAQPVRHPFPTCLLPLAALGESDTLRPYWCFDGFNFTRERTSGRHQPMRKPSVYQMPARAKHDGTTSGSCQAGNHQPRSVAVERAIGDSPEWH